MERIFTYNIDAQTCGMDVMDFLRKRGYSRHILASMKPDRQAIQVNGEHVLMRYVLQDGDVLTTRVTDPVSSEHIVPAPVPFGIIYEDADILVINKYANTAIHPAISHPANTLANGVVWYYQQQGIPFVFRCINRLDRDTTGLLIVAKNLVSACVLEQSLLRREIHRTYLALADGELDEAGTIDLPLARKEGSLIERCVDLEKGDRAVTHYQTLRVIDYARAHSSDQMERTCSLVQLQLETGRTHQIRVHMAHLGHPLLGDSLYHPDYLRRPEEAPRPGAVMGRQALHSWKLDFVHPITEENLHFEAPIPDDMQVVCHFKS